MTNKARRNAKKLFPRPLHPRPIWAAYFKTTTEEQSAVIAASSPKRAA